MAHDPYFPSKTLSTVARKAPNNIAVVTTRAVDFQTVHFHSVQQRIVSGIAKWNLTSQLISRKCQFREHLSAWDAGDRTGKLVSIQTQNGQGWRSLLVQLKICGGIKHAIERSGQFIVPHIELV